MSIQQKKEYLKRYKYVARNIERILEELQKWMDLSLKVLPLNSQHIKNTNISDKTYDAVENITKLRIELNFQTNQYIKIRNEIEKTVDTINDDTLHLLLCYRYIDDMTWEEIADKLNYSYMQVCRLHLKALEQIKI